MEPPKEKPPEGGKEVRVIAMRQKRSHVYY